MPFEPWKTCTMNPFFSFFFSLLYVLYVFCVCVWMLLIETSGWERNESLASRSQSDRREPSSMAWYRVVSIGRHAAWGSLRSGFVTPQSTRWWMGIVAIGCCVHVCARRPHIHTYHGAAGEKRDMERDEKEEKEGEKEERMREMPPGQMMSRLFLLLLLPPFFLSLCYSHPGALCGGTRIADRYIYLYTSPPFIYKYRG